MTTSPITGHDTALMPDVQADLVLAAHERIVRRRRARRRTTRAAIVLAIALVLGLAVLRALGGGDDAPAQSSTGMLRLGPVSTLIGAAAPDPVGVAGCEPADRDQAGADADATARASTSCSRGGR